MFCLLISSILTCDMQMPFHLGKAKKTLKMSSSKLLFQEFFEFLITGDLTADVEITSIPDFENLKNQVFHCSFEGPFIFCLNAQESSRPANAQQIQPPIQQPEFPNYYPIFFTPHYIFSEIPQKNTIVFVPIFPDLVTSFKLKFFDQKTMKTWKNHLFDVRYSIEKMYKELPPFVLQVDVDGIENFTSVSALVSDKNLMYEVSNRTVQEWKMDQISTMNILSSAIQTMTQNPFSTILSIRMDKSKRHIIHFKSKDDFILGFFVIYYGMSSCAKHKQNRIVDMVFAKQPEIHEIEFKSEFSPVSKPFISTSVTQRYPLTFKPSISPLLNQLKKVSVPKKASDQLEILLFGLPMKRRVFFASSSSEQKKQFKHKKRKLTIHVSLENFNLERNFDRELDKIVDNTNFKDMNMLVPVKQTPSRPSFKILEQSLLDFFDSHNTPDDFLSGKEPEVAPDVKELFDYLKFPVDLSRFQQNNQQQSSQPLQSLFQSTFQQNSNQQNQQKKEYRHVGDYLLSKIDDIISNLERELKKDQTDLISLQFDKYSKKLVLLLSSLINDIPKPSIDLLQEISQLTEKEKSLAFCFPNNNIHKQERTNSQQTPKIPKIPENFSRQGSKEIASEYTPRSPEKEQNISEHASVADLKQKQQNEINEKLMHCCVFISRLLFSKKLCLFFKLLINESDWRFHNYLPGSLMLSTPLLTDICEKLISLEKITFVGSFPSNKSQKKPPIAPRSPSQNTLASTPQILTGSNSNLLKDDDFSNDTKKYRNEEGIKLVSLESIENRIISVCKAILDSQRKRDNKSSSNSQKEQEERKEEQGCCLGLLISLICEFFNIGFVPPDSCIISCLRSSWYTFASSVELPVNEHKFYALKAIVRECSMNYATTPQNLMRLFFYKGFVNGITWAFVLFGGARAQIDNLYKSDAPAASPAKVSTIALALSSLRTTLIEADEETVLEYAEYFTFLPHL